MGPQGSVIKRVTDIIISLTVLALTSPLMILCMAAIKIESKGPAIFKQARTGLNGKTFMMFKLRGMVNNAEKLGPLLTEKNDPRLTKTGKLFRRLSIDEIPQFYNVLIGDMSIVGPRPEVVSITEGFSAAHREVFNFKPGITGYSQINGRQMLTSEERCEMEIPYYKTATFFSDLMILLKTPYIVLSNKGNL